jgi:hypothetical protein
MKWFIILGITAIATLGIVTFFALFKTNSKEKRSQSTGPLHHKHHSSQNPYPMIEVTKEQVRDAIRKYSDELPKGIYRSILVNDDYSIDFEKLTPILKGIPSSKFYMSKETYDIFDETEKEIPALMDQVQKAVDAYQKDHNQYPILPFDPLRRVNYYLLRNEHYLKFQPDIDFYITKYDGIITHIKPSKAKDS